MFATRDEHDVVAVLKETAADDPADTARVDRVPSDVAFGCSPSCADVEIEGQGRPAIRLRCEDRLAGTEPVEVADDSEQPLTIDLNAEQPAPAATEAERKRGRFSSF